MYKLEINTNVCVLLTIAYIWVKITSLLTFIISNYTEMHKQNKEIAYRLTWRGL